MGLIFLFITRLGDGCDAVGFLIAVYIAIYFLGKGKIAECIENTLQSLDLSVIINNSGAFAQAVALFEFCRGQATDAHLNNYKGLLEEVRKRERFNLGFHNY